MTLQNKLVIFLLSSSLLHLASSGTALAAIVTGPLTVTVAAQLPPRWDNASSSANVFSDVGNGDFGFASVDIAGIAADKNSNTLYGVVTATGGASWSFIHPNGSGVASFTGDAFKNKARDSGGGYTPRGSINHRFEVVDARTSVVFRGNYNYIAGGDAVGSSGPNPGTGLRYIISRPDLGFVVARGEVNAGPTTIDLSPGNYNLELTANSIGNVSWSEDSVFTYETKSFFQWGWGSELPGSSPENPIQMIKIADGSFWFDTITDTAITYYDPEFAIGYDYVTEDTSFASVLVPSSSLMFDNTFDLVVGSTVHTLTTDELFDFTAIAPEGVREFGIRGLSLAEQLDPTDPATFVAGLSFVDSGTLASFRMTPVTVPEPSSCMMLCGLGIIGLITRRTRRRSGLFYGNDIGM